MAEQKDLVDALVKLQSLVVKMYGQAHGYHWNVEGAGFPQYHKFLLKIYSDVYESIDPISENLRKLGAKAPFGVKEWNENSDLEINDSEGLGVKQMFQELLNTNTIVLAMLRRTFDISNELDEQGICNFIAGRIEQHQFWNWQLTATLKPTIM
jgi:starvation-inducible DNA-binding protein